MLVMNQSSTANCKCVVCGRIEGNSLIYKEKGIEVKMPLCHRCMETRSEEFNKNIKIAMTHRIAQIKGDINIEIDLTFHNGN